MVFEIRFTLFQLYKTKRFVFLTINQNPKNLYLLLPSQYLPRSKTVKVLSNKKFHFF